MESAGSRAWWCEALLGLNARLGGRGVSQLVLPIFTHCSGFSRPAPASCPQPPAPLERSQFHLVAAGQPEGCKTGGPGVFGLFKKEHRRKHHVRTLTLSEILQTPRPLTWALQNRFISSSLARRSRVRRHVGYLLMVPEFLAKIFRAYGRVRPVRGRAWPHCWIGAGEALFGRDQSFLSWR